MLRGITTVKGTLKISRLSQSYSWALLFPFSEICNVQKANMLPFSHDLKPGVSHTCKEWSSHKNNTQLKITKQVSFKREQSVLY